MPVEIVPIRAEHVEGFHRALDIVACERRHLALLEAPPVERSRAFVLGNIERGHPQFVAVMDAEVVGWCDITPMTGRPTHIHRGVLGMGLLPQFRGRGIGGKLPHATLIAAREFGLHRVELTVRQDMRARSRSTGRQAFTWRANSATPSGSTASTRTSSAWRSCSERDEIGPNRLLSSLRQLKPDSVALAKQRALVGFAASEGRGPRCPRGRHGACGCVRANVTPGGRLPTAACRSPRRCPSGSAGSRCLPPASRR